MEVTGRIKVPDGWAERNGQRLVDFLYELKAIAAQSLETKWTNQYGEEMEGTSLSVWHAISARIDAELEAIETEIDWTKDG